jgi:uncharacterized damage-inducible protein DinB
MLLLATLRELFTYNYWARDRQLEACAALSPDELVRPLGNSFSCMRDTLAHLVGAEWVWLERLCGRSPEALPEIQEFPTLEAIKERWRTVEQGIRRYLASLREEACSGMSSTRVSALKHGNTQFGWCLFTSSITKPTIEAK